MLTWKKLAVLSLALAALGLGPARAEETPSESKDFKECREAVVRSDADAVKKLIKEHPKIVTETSEHGDTLLHLLAIYALKATPGQAEIAEALIDAGAAVNAVNRAGCTPLHEAANTRSVAVTSALLRAGADLRVRKKLPGIDKLPADEQHPEDAETPIDVASYRGFAFLVEKLLAAKVPIEYPETQRLKGFPPVKDSAFHFACRNCVYSKTSAARREDACKTIDLLCAKISDINVKNLEGRSPLLVAADWGSPALVEHLLTKYPTVKIDFQDTLGNTALHLAVDGKTTPELGVEVVRVLLKHGADKNIKNVSGDTPLTIARSKDNKEAVSLLTKE